MKGRSRVGKRTIDKRFLGRTCVSSVLHDAPGFDFTLPDDFEALDSDVNVPDP